MGKAEKLLLEARRLPLEEKLSDRVLLDLVIDTKPDSRQRKRACMVAQALAKFAKIKLVVMGVNIDTISKVDS